jgi:hypothetical protein
MFDRALLTREELQARLQAVRLQSTAAPDLTGYPAGGDGGDSNRLARAIQKRCLAQYGGFMKGGAFVGADGRPVQRSLAKPGVVTTDAAAPTFEQSAADPNRLANAVKRLLARSR